MSASHKAMAAAPMIEPFRFDRAIDALGAPPPGGAALLARLHAAEAALAAMTADQPRLIAEARAAARAEALAEAEASHAAATLHSVEALNAALDEAEAERTGAQAALAAAAARLALHAARHMAGRALAERPEAAVADAIEQALALVARGTPLRAHVAPDLAERMAALLAEAQAQDRRHRAVELVADDGLLPGDAHIVWESGDLIARAADREAGMATSIDALIAALECGEAVAERAVDADVPPAVD